MLVILAKICTIILFTAFFACAARIIVRATKDKEERITVVQAQKQFPVIAGDVREMDGFVSDRLMVHTETKEEGNSSESCVSTRNTGNTG
ncbi:MAG: hypothetical protein LUE14_02975 [Clostridiales bacterium]|nr:hypothetical protein [Clostridiales bacterium]